MNSWRRTFACTGGAVVWIGLAAFVRGALLLQAAVLPQEIYVWQRAWAEPVRKAVAEHGAAFDRITVLVAEVTWRDGRPELARANVDYPVLASIRRPIGLALRIGPFAGPFGGSNPAAIYLSTLARSLIAEAKAAGLDVSELQLDFDCAASKLDGYRSWVERIRPDITPVPLAVTALPSWLNEPAFKSVAETAGAYILQVHSLARPRDYDAPFTLCDPEAARRAATRASEIGVPFRIALPTYGYLIAFDSTGRFIGLSAEGPVKGWPRDVRVREVRADPLEMGQLAQFWASNRLKGMEGVIWYRLPNSDDILNWRWPTLRCILERRTPRKSVRGEAHRVETGLVEISLVNDGELDISSRLAVRTRWQGSRLVAGDGLRGFRMAAQELSSARLDSGARPHRLPAGEQQVIGWLRLTEEREVLVELEQLEAP